jgi:hypothetical protein
MKQALNMSENYNACCCRKDNKFMPGGTFLEGREVRLTLQAVGMVIFWWQLIASIERLRENLISNSVKTDVERTFPQPAYTICSHQPYGNGNESTIYEKYAELSSLQVEVPVTRMDQLRNITNLMDPKQLSTIGLRLEDMWEEVLIPALWRSGTGSTTFERCWTFRSPLPARVGFQYTLTFYKAMRGKGGTLSVVSVYDRGSNFGFSNRDHGVDHVFMSLGQITDPSKVNIHGYEVRRKKRRRINGHNGVACREEEAGQTFTACVENFVDRART